MALMPLTDNGLDTSQLLFGVLGWCWRIVLVASQHIDCKRSRCCEFPCKKQESTVTVKSTRSVYLWLSTTFIAVYRLLLTCLLLLLWILHLIRFKHRPRVVDRQTKESSYSISGTRCRSFVRTLRVYNQRRTMGGLREMIVVPRHCTIAPYAAGVERLPATMVGRQGPKGRTQGQTCAHARLSTANKTRH